MTINVILVTSDAVILRCDSTASRGNYYINPFAIGLEVDPRTKDHKGEDGRLTVKFQFDEIEHVVTEAWGGVTKMFPLCEKYCHVAAVASGLASLNQRSMSSLASEFRANQALKKAADRKRTVRGIAEEFLQFVRSEYERAYEGSPLPTELRDGPEFLIGGVGQKDKFPCSYRVRVMQNDVTEDFVDGACGVSWNAQSDAVERIIRGYDRKLRDVIDNSFSEAMSAYQVKMNEAVLRILDNVLKELNVKMPKSVDTTLPSEVTMSPQWDKFRTAIPYSVLPLQEAVHFVGYLIMMQAGKSRFAPGVATVGGRTHIGVITKDEGFRQLNEPELTHQHTGFADDY